MGLGQSILTMAALVFITFLVISANRMVIESAEDELTAQATILAPDMAAALINEALKKDFDLYTGSNASTSQFTSASSLGPSSSEASVVTLPDHFPYRSIAGYSDFDDYDGYVRIVNTPLIQGFIVRSTVYICVIKYSRLSRISNLYETYCGNGRTSTISYFTSFIQHSVNVLVMGILDIIQSYFIKGMIILIIVEVTLMLQDTLYEKAEKSIIEQELSTASFAFSSDFRQIGYNVSSIPFILTDTSEIKFLGDFDNNGTPDQIRYYLTPADSSKYILYRVINTGIPLPIGRNLTQFRLSYYDSLGNTTSNKSNIKSVLVIMQMQSKSYINGTYPKAAWQAHIFPPNL